MLLENKVAVVTGGAKGMGRGIALRFAQEGCSVVLCDLDLEGCESTAELVRYAIRFAASEGPGQS